MKVPEMLFYVTVYFITFKYQCASTVIKVILRSSLFFLHSQLVSPERQGDVELEGVDQCEDEHGVHHHRHPEVLQDPPPPLVVHLNRSNGDYRGNEFSAALMHEMYHRTHLDVHCRVTALF